MVPPDAPASPFLARLKRRLESRDQRRSVSYPYANATLIYVIDGPASVDGRQTVLHVMVLRRTRTGSQDKPKHAVLTPDIAALAPPTDRRLLALLTGATQRVPASALDDHTDFESGQTTFRLPPALAVELLPAIARTARAWLRTGPDAGALEPLAWDDGNTWSGRLIIAEDADGFTVTGQLVRDHTIVPFTEPFVLLAERLVALRGKLGRFDGDESVPVLVELRSRGGVTRVSSADRATLAEVLATSGVTVTDLPASLHVDDVRVKPVPRLAVHRGPIVGTETLAAQVTFAYDGTVAPHSGPLSVFDQTRGRLVHRDPDAERAAYERLADAGFHHGGPGSTLTMPLTIEADRFPPAARHLLEEGWDVRAEGVRYRAPQRVKLSVTSGVDWFDLSATADFGDYQMPLVDVLAALKREGPMVRLGDGSMGLLPEDWLERFGALTKAGEPADDQIRFRRSQAALLDALLADRETEADIRVDAIFDKARQELATFSHPQPLNPPPSFTGVLRPYQREGLGWFEFLRRFGFGGCLADDMGLGKTIMVLALLDARRRAADPDVTRKPTLVVVPRSLVGNWLAEAARFTPELRLADHSQAQRPPTSVVMAENDAVLVTYGTLRRDIATLDAIEFDYVVLDEAQTIKNASTAAAKAARLLRADHRLALSGTPIENHLGELWSLFEFLNPGILGRSSVFQRTAGDPATSRETTSVLSRGLRPFILRRTKQQVASELPARTEQTIFCELLPKDRRLYDSLRRHYRSSLLDKVERDGLNSSKMHVLEALLRLRQAACHPALIDPARALDESAKFDVLLPQLQEVVEEGHKAIVFSQFTTLLGLLRTRLDAAKMTYEYLDGKTRDRTARVARFQDDPNVGVFLISLKAGGLGLNLTAAEYVFLLDPWWNPAVEAQAIDRAHRIGQTREVFAYRLIAKDTVEEKVLELQQSKRALADAVLEANAVGLRHLSRDDLDMLLS